MEVGPTAVYVQVLVAGERLLAKRDVEHVTEDQAVEQAEAER